MILPFFIVHHILVNKTEHENIKSVKGTLIAYSAREDAILGMLQATIQRGR